MTKEPTKRPRQAKLAARDVAVYLLDRADQYVTESACWVALSDAAHNVMLGEVEAAKRNGDLTADLYERVDGFIGHIDVPRPVVPTAGVNEDDDGIGDEDDDFLPGIDDWNERKVK